MRRTRPLLVAPVALAGLVLTAAPAWAAEPDACTVDAGVLIVTIPAGAGAILGEAGGAITLSTGDPLMPQAAECRAEGATIMVSSLTSIVLQDDDNADAEPSHWALQTDTGFGTAPVTIHNTADDRLHVFGTDVPHVWAAASTTGLDLDEDGTADVELDSAPSRTELRLGSGSDVVDLPGWTGRTEIYLGDGADSVTGGSGPDEVYDDAGGFGSGPDVIHTGAGDDLVLLDGDGADTVTMGSGADFLRVRNDSTADDVDAGSGNDTMFYQNTVPVTWNPEAPGGDGAPGENDDLTGFDIVRSEGAGVTAWAPSTGLALHANQGSSTLIGGPGPDDLHANPGSATARFSFQRSTAGVTVQLDSNGGFGQAGADFDVFHGQVDAVTGSPHADGILLGNLVSRVTVRPGLGNDLVHTTGDTSLVSEAVADGADTMYCEDTEFSCAWDYSARTAPVNVTVNEDDDDTGADDGAPGEGDQVPARVQVIGGRAGDTLVGHGARDVLFGWLGNDTLIGRGGADVLQGDAGTDSLAGGSGDDVLTGSDGNDLLYGGSGEDGLEGDGGADRLDGGMGDDTERGGTDSDTFVQGAATGENGSDLLIGGTGSLDTVTYQGRAAGVRITNNGAYGDGATGEGDNVRADIEKLVGTSYADTLLGGLGIDRLYGNGGKDLLRGGANNDYLDLGTGTDTAYGDAGNDRFYAKDGSKDILYGGTGTDLARRDTVDVRSSIEGSF